MNKLIYFCVALLCASLSIAFSQDVTLTHKPNDFVPFRLDIAASGQVKISDRNPFMEIPNQTTSQKNAKENLLKIWQQYYEGFLVGNEEVLTAYAATGKSYPAPSRSPNDEASLSILTVSGRDNSVRIIVRWKFTSLLNKGEKVSEFIDCHVWREVEPGKWRVRSVLRED